MYPGHSKNELKSGPYVSYTTSSAEA